MCASRKKLFYRTFFIMGSMPWVANISSAAGAHLEEVIVTAQKREENIQNVPLAISALTGDDMEKKGINSYDGIARATPSITFTPYANSSNTLTIYMRGQGFIDPGQITADGAIGLYEDGFYIGRPQASTFDLADLERVEVLRGPQGTIFGRNTTGGAVNLISKQPTGNFGFKQDFSFGTRNLSRSLTAIDMPRIGDVATKITLLKSAIDGYVKNVGSGHDFGEQSQLAGRFMLHWDATPSLSTDYFMEKGNLDSTPIYYQNPALNGQPLFDANTPYFAKNSPMSKTYRAVDLPESTSSFEGHGLTVTWDVDDYLTIKSLTGYRKLNWAGYQDYVEVFGLPYTSSDKYNQHQFSQELQFIGSLLDGDVNYVMGLYYFKESGSHDQTYNIAGYIPVSVVTMESKSKAIFGQISWAPEFLNRNLEFTLGGRYTKDDKSAERFISNNVSGVVEAGAATGSNNSQSFGRFTPSFTVNYQWAPDINTYARFATGYKAGGSAEGSPPGTFNNTFGPEEVTSYELGLKSFWFEHKVRANIALFNSRVKDMQLFLGADPYATYFQAYNAGRATIKGLEVGFLIAPIEDLAMSLDYTYLHPEFDKVDVVAGTTFDPAVNNLSPYQIGQNVKDKFSMPYAPKSSVDFGADYTFFHFSSGNFSAHIDYRWQDKIFTTPNTGKDVPNADFSSIPSYGILNGRVTLALDLPRGDQAKIGLWAKNIARKTYYQSAAGNGAGPVPLNSTDPATGNPIVSPAGYTSRSAAWGEPPAFGIDIQYQY